MVKNGENIVQPSIEAVKVYATIEEVMNALLGDKVKTYRDVIRAGHRQIAV